MANVYLPTKFLLAGGRRHLAFPTNAILGPSANVKQHTKFGTNRSKTGTLASLFPRWCHVKIHEQVYLGQLFTDLHQISCAASYMANVYLPTKFDANILINDRDMADKQNSKWRPPPSWIFNECCFGAPVVLTWPIWSSTQNLVQIGQGLAEIQPFVCLSARTLTVSFLDQFLSKMARR